MKLLRASVNCPDTLGQLDLSFSDGDGKPRPLTLIQGGPGCGKTTLLAAIAATRPGHTASLNNRPSEARCFASCDWWLGIDEPDRAFPLSLCSPNAPEEARPESLRNPSLDVRREISFFDRLAREGGFVLVAFSALRWFSKSPLVMSNPQRSVTRYDVRGSDAFDDASRNDLARDVKQTLAYAAIVRVLPQADEDQQRVLGEAVRRVVDDLVQLYGYRYGELDPQSLEPVFHSPTAQRVSFDALPSAVKSSVAFGALTLRALWAAYGGMDPRRGQGVVLIDQIELHQDSSTAIRIMEVLALAMPDVQWIITTRSVELLAARSCDETIALRRLESQADVSIHTGQDSVVH